MSSDDGGLKFYEDTGEEDSVLLYHRDELMNSILEDEDALITEHRKHIEYTMTVVRLEMSLLTEVRACFHAPLAAGLSRPPQQQSGIE